METALQKETCKIADIEVDFFLNVRTEIDQDVVGRYAAIFDQLPPITVFDIGKPKYLLSDGFHRIAAAQQLELDEIEVVLKTGTKEESEEFGIDANMTHGLAYNRAARKNAAVRKLKFHPERSDSWVAQEVGVDHKSVRKYREELESAGEIPKLGKLIGKDGKEYPREVLHPRRKDLSCLLTRRDSASDILLRCVDANVFSKDVGKALIKYPLEAQDVIAGQIEQMKERPPSSKILDWIQKFEEIDDEFFLAIMRGFLKIKYFDNLYKLWNVGEEDLIQFIGEYDRQFVAFDPVYKEACCVTSHGCIIKSMASYEETKNYHPVMRVMERANLVGSPGDVYRVSYGQLFLDDDAAYSALMDEGIRINRDWDYMFSAVIEARNSLRVQAPVDWNEATVKLIHPIISRIQELCIGHNFEITMADEKELLVIGKLVIGKNQSPITSNQSLLKSPITPQRCTWRLTSMPDLFVDEGIVWKLAEKYDFDFEIVEGGFEDECPEGETDSGHAGPGERACPVSFDLVDLSSPIDGEQMDKDFLEANPEAKVGEEEGEVPDGPDFREKLARLCHTQWSGWMTYLFNKGDHNDDGTWTMPAWAVERWTLQMNTLYSELSDAEKESDREEADKFIELMAL